MENMAVLLSVGGNTAESLTGKDAFFFFLLHWESGDLVALTWVKLLINEITKDKALPVVFSNFLAPFSVSHSLLSFPYTKLFSGTYIVLKKKNVCGLCYHKFKSG